MTRYLQVFSVNMSRKRLFSASNVRKYQFREFIPDAGGRTVECSRRVEMAQAKKPKKAMTQAEKDARRESLKGESKSDKFRRLAMKRVPKAIKALASVENLANYDYSEDQATKVLDIVGGAMKRVANAFAGQKNAASEFTI
jgi:hypothetical protein